MLPVAHRAQSRHRARRLIEAPVVMPGLVRPGNQGRPVALARHLQPDKRGVIRPLRDRSRRLQLGRRDPHRAGHVPENAVLWRARFPLGAAMIKKCVGSS